MGRRTGGGGTVRRAGTGAIKWMQPESGELAGQEGGVGNGPRPTATTVGAPLLPALSSLEVPGRGGIDPPCGDGEVVPGVVGRSSDSQALCQTAQIPTGRRFPIASAISALLTAFVPAHRCGAAPDSHRVPSSRRNSPPYESSRDKGDSGRGYRERSGSAPPGWRERPTGNAGANIAGPRWFVKGAVVGPLQHLDSSAAADPRPVPGPADPSGRLRGAHIPR